MPSVYQAFKLFISSPSDVKKERALAQSVIRSVSQSCRDSLALLLEDVTWESEPPLARTSQSIQDRLIERLRECDGFVLILYERYGSIEPGETESNTAREIRAALDKLSNDPSFMFLTYFRSLPIDRDPGPHRLQVEAQREALKTRKGVWVREYSTPAEFARMCTHDLYKSVLNQRFATAEQKVLRRFWQIGTTAGHSRPRVAIIYPPVQRAYMASQKPDRIWLKSLTPHLVFEDSKAMHKIDKALRVIGVKNVHSFGTHDLPKDIDNWNRVWLCLPRSKPGLARLERYKKSARFSFISKERERVLLWQSEADPLSSIEIRSPFRKYLQQQRGRTPGGECSASHLNIVARDFAVIARFTDLSRRAMESGSLRDYFFAGLRGLGTWGSAWLLDSRFHLLEKYVEYADRDVQLLLEVTYKNGRIHDVLDVSDRSQSYFVEQNDVSMIRQIIRSIQAT